MWLLAGELEGHLCFTFFLTWALFLKKNIFLNFGTFIHRHPSDSTKITWNVGRGGRYLWQFGKPHENMHPELQNPGFKDVWDHEIHVGTLIMSDYKKELFFHIHYPLQSSNLKVTLDTKMIKKIINQTRQ